MTMTTIRGAVTSLGAAALLAGTAACGTSSDASHSATSASPTASSSNGTQPAPSASGSSRASASGPTPADSGSTSTGPASDATSSSAKGGDTRGQGAGTGSGAAYDVVSVIDGDTIAVRIDGKREKIRIIGLDTPETRKPNTPVQCFGKEASSHMQSLVQSKQVQLAADSSQGDRDKYGRLLRHVFVGGTTNVALAQIEGGYGREYTYDGPYQHRLEYLAAQNQAKNAHRGTWGPPCNGFHQDDAGSSAAASTSAAPAPSTPVASAVPAAPSSPAGAGSSGGACAIKGNINSKGAKIAHAPGSATYDKTVITPSKGERMFCSAAEAIAAGWRMAND